MDTATMDSTRRCLFPDDDLPYGSEAELDSLYLFSNSNPTHRSQQSPTGVSEYFVMKETQPLHSVIEVGEDGAEVTLMLVTPEKAESSPLRKGIILGDVRRNSLMDVDWTPTPPASKAKPSSNNFVDVWCGNASTSCVSDEVYHVPTGRHLEEAISSFLGDNDNSDGFQVCSDWQEWSFSFSSNNVSEVHDTPIETIRAKMQKRVLNMKSRKSRIHQLRRDLSPFNRSPGRSSPQLARSRSFSISDHASAIVRQSTDHPRRRNTFNVLQLCTLPENAMSDSPMILRYNATSDRDGVCYDSDPEDFARHRSPDQFDLDKENDNTYPSPFALRHRTRMGELAYSATIQEFLNRTFTLVYHPMSKERSMEPSNPIALDAWLERGQILNELIQPKWMWMPKSKFRGKGPLIQAGTVRSIDLLDITRIVAVVRVDRTLYPFAKPHRSFIIRNIDGEECCFEAKSSDECDLIVLSLKLAIARFGAMVLTTDHRVYEEFFVREDCVPGQPPELINLLDDMYETGTSM